MLWRNTAMRYGIVQKAFHWVIAALILINLALGLLFDEVPMGPTKFGMFFWHKSIGILVLALATLRLVWKLVNPRPAKDPDHAPWERYLAAFVHFLLYLAMITMPLSGWLGSAAKGVAVSVFGWFTLPNVVTPNHNLARALFTYHSWAGWTLLGLIALHVVGALKHHLIDRDDTLRRMLPFGRVKGSTVAAGVVALLLLSQTPAHAAPPVWQIDSAGSHLAFMATQNDAPFTGSFPSFTGEIAFDPKDLDHSHLAITVPLAGLTTGSEERDPYLGQPAWFDTARFPVATYAADEFRANGAPGAYVAHGMLQVHGVKKTVDVPFTVTFSPDGKTASAQGVVHLRRLEFDVGSGEWADTRAVGNDVTVEFTVAAHHP